MEEKLYGICENKCLKEVVPKEDIENYKLKGDFAVVTGSISLSNGTGWSTVDYPEGFTAENCVAISIGLQNIYGTVGIYSYFSASTMMFEARLLEDNIAVSVCPRSDGVGPTKNTNFKVVLMKVS